MNVTFIGSGYVGLVSGIMMSYLGHNVICLDSDRLKISKLQQNILPLYEPGLDKYLLPLMESGKLKFTSQYDKNLKSSDIVFITVGTPPLPSGAADLKYVFNAINNVSRFVKKDCLIVIKSTVPPTTCNRIINYLKEKNLSLQIASNPEFLREGSAVNDFLNPDRIIIGTCNKYTEELLKELYLPLIKRNIQLNSQSFRQDEFETTPCAATIVREQRRMAKSSLVSSFVNDAVPIISTDLITAELIKYASNAFLATKITFINEMANLCEEIGANSQELSLGIGTDKRIGQEFLKAGPGFGGSCFPKDILALLQLARYYKVDCTIANAVINANEQRVVTMVNKIIDIVDSNNLHNKIITILGLTFKAGTDDIRASPAIAIVKLLLNKGANVSIFDPVGMENTRQYFDDVKLDFKGNLKYGCSAINACENSNAIVITTEWPEFKELEWELIYNHVKSPIIIDLRNLLNNNTMKEKNFQYYAIGIKSQPK